MLDGLREVIVEHRLWLLILLVFFGAPVFWIFRWSAAIISAPIEAVRQGSYLGRCLCQ